MLKPELEIQSVSASLAHAPQRRALIVSKKLTKRG